MSASRVSSKWPRQVGGLGFLIIVWGAPALASIAPLGINGSRASGLVAALLAAPGLLFVALVAPLVGYRRRDWLFNFVPVIGVFVFYEIGARIAELSNLRKPITNGSAETLAASH